MKALDQLRALARYKTHAGYVWAAVTNDGELLCTPCVRENYRQIFKATRDRANDGWECIGLAHSGEGVETEHCAHCSRAIWEYEDYDQA
jgi:hypothetical protein